MFGAGYWAYPEVDGVRFCYAKAPTYRCPIAEALGRPVGAALAEGAAPRLPLAEAADVLGIDPTRLGAMLRTAHSRSHEVRARVDGKPTDRCAVCGHRLDRLGFRVWREHLVPEGELTSEQRASARLGEVFGGDGLYWATTESLYLDTKREAATWARENYETAKLAQLIGITGPKA